MRADEFALVMGSKMAEAWLRRGRAHAEERTREDRSGAIESLDGFIAGASDNANQRAADPMTRHGGGGDRLFSWLTGGDTPSRVNPNFNMSAPSAAFFDEGVDATGAVVAGRRSYDVSGAWDGRGSHARSAPLRHDPPGPERSSYRRPSVDVRH